MAASVLFVKTSAGLADFRIVLSLDLVHKSSKRFQFAFF